MADFRQLALEFVLEDDKTKAHGIAQRAASEIEKAAANSNPVARWVESVQPWMPGSHDDDLMRDANDTPDWTARAKALEFLSQTLDFLLPDTLKASQVKLLVAFFGAMYDVDHKAGILASSSALSRIISMKSFHPTSGKDIIQKICTLKEDFPRQVAKTRLAVYELLRSLISNPEVARDLKQHYGEDADFMKSLLPFCQNERDPDCLIVWFDILRLFLSEYTPSKDRLEEVYSTFKAYFPITLPRLAQSGVTPEDLKLQLRKCFASNQDLASLALPFLIGKLDQGDGVTVNVKVDVLRTIRACLEEYQDAKEFITPYVNRIWTSLKYEVRNGEIEDAIWATLEVLKTLATRLTDDDLRDYTLTVTRDCVADLATPMYTTAAGRLLVSVLSASPGAFVLMVAPAVTHIKENLRHPKSPTQSQDLLKILRIILETRLLLADTDISEQDRNDFAAVDGVFKTLYSDIYKSLLELVDSSDASDEEFKLSTEAVQGIGALAGQREMRTSNFKADGVQSPLLLPTSVCAESCETLFNIATRPWAEKTRRMGSDDLVNETTKALQRIINAYPGGFEPLVTKSTFIIRQSMINLTNESLSMIQSLCPLLAYIACSSIADNLSTSLGHYLRLMQGIVAELFASIRSRASPRAWCALAAGINSTARYFNDGCLAKDSAARETAANSSLTNIATKYPCLASMGVAGGDAQDISNVTVNSVTEARTDALLIGLYVTGLLYKRATQPSHAEGQLVLSTDFDASEPHSEHRYLYHLSELASFIIHELNESQQASLEVEQYSLNLFRREDIGTKPPASWSWLTSGHLNMLSIGILEALRPSRMAKLYERGVAQHILIDDTMIGAPTMDATSPVKRSILAVLANKHKVETFDNVMTHLEKNLRTALSNIEGSAGEESVAASLETCLSIYAVIGGLLRRYSGKQIQTLLEILRTAPKHIQFGYRLARGLEIIVAPQRSLSKESFAVIRPLWLQKAYIELAKPMLDTALETGSAPNNRIAKTNYSLAVLLMVKHMSFSIYEEDADKILRIAIAIAQNLGAGSDCMAALQVIRNILVEASDKAQDHIRSLIKICTGIFTNRGSSSGSRPEWLPAEYDAGVDDSEIQAGSGKLALEIVGGLPRMFEPRHLLAYEPQVQRDLSTACGHRVRELRSTARLARGAWADVK